MPLCISLTGGIGSGKSTAAGMFEELGATVIDTDAIARGLTGPGGAATAAIREAFGTACVGGDGALDRAKMRRLVFADPEARAKLEGILHPLIRRQALELASRSHGPYVLLVVPLLLETGAYGEVIDRVLVVDCDEALQVARAATRNGLSEEEVRAVMAAQLPRQRRLAGAHDVIRNDGDIESLRRQVTATHARYLELAHDASRNSSVKRRKTIK